MSNLNIEMTKDYFFITEFAGAIIALIVTIILKYKLDSKKYIKEEKEIKDEVSKYIEIIDKSEKDVLALMIKNVAELREYYVINKQQARKSFSAALFMSILGFILFGSGVVISHYFPEKNTMQYSTIGGAVVEIIAGLFFWLYSKAIMQISLFHTSLLKTERFLTAIQPSSTKCYHNRNRCAKSPDFVPVPISNAFI